MESAKEAESAGIDVAENPHEGYHRSFSQNKFMYAYQFTEFVSTTALVESGFMLWLVALSSNVGCRLFIDTGRALATRGKGGGGGGEFPGSMSLVYFTAGMSV